MLIVFRFNDHQYINYLENELKFKYCKELIVVEGRLSTKEVSKCLKISYNKALKMMKSGEIPSYISTIAGGRDNSIREYRYTYPSLVELYQQDEINKVKVKYIKRISGRTKLYRNPKELDSRNIKDYLQQEL